MSRKPKGDRFIGVYPQGKSHKAIWIEGGIRHQKSFRDKGGAENFGRTVENYLDEKLNGEEGVGKITKLSKEAFHVSQVTQDPTRGSQAGDWLGALWSACKHIEDDLKDHDIDVKDKCKLYDALSKLANSARRHMDLTYSTQSVHASEVTGGMSDDQLMNEIESIMKTNPELKELQDGTK